MKTDVAIVLLNYNSWKMTQSLLDTLVTWGFGESIFVIDNASPDDSAQKLATYCKLHGCHFTANEHNAGYAAGNNIGLRQAYDKKFKYALIINNDIEFKTAFDIAEMRIVFNQNKKIACVCPRIVNPNGTEVAQRLYRPSAWDFSFGIFSFEKRLRKETKQRQNNFPIYRAHGSCMMVDLRVMDKIGYLDENTFLYFEESILAENMLKYGYLTYCAGQVSVLHNHSVVTKRNLVKKQMINIYARSADIYLGNYRGWRFPKKQLCVMVKSLSMLKGWM